MTNTRRARRFRTVAHRENWYVRLDPAGNAGRGAYLKRHEFRSLGTSFRAAFRLGPGDGPGSVEARNILALNACGLPTPGLIAYGERLSPGGTLTSFVLTEELVGFMQLDEFLEGRFPPTGAFAAEHLQGLLGRVAETARTFHRAGYNHRDFYTCHFFVREPAPGQFELALIDLQRVQRRRSLRRRWIVKDLAQLLYSIPHCGIRCRHKVEFIRRYLGVTSLGSRQRRLVRDVLRKEARMRRRLGPYKEPPAPPPTGAAEPLPDGSREPKHPDVTKQEFSHGAHMNPYRIAVLIEHFDPHRGGAERWTQALVSRLIELGHEVHVIAGGFGDADCPEGMTRHRLSRSKSRLIRAEEAEHVVGTLQPDVVHDMGLGWCGDVFQPHGGSRTAAFEGNLRLAPAVLRPVKRRLAAVLPRYRQFHRLTERQFRNPDCLFIALSRMVQEHFEAYHGVPRERIRLVYNGVDVRQFAPEVSRAHRSDVRRKLGLSDDEVLFVIVAHNFRLKGVPQLLKALARLNATEPRAHLAVVGGKRAEPSRRQARRLGIADRVHFIGAVPDPRPYYGAADVYVQPTFYDPCSLVVLEALACGLPVITSRLNGAGELLTPGAHGYLMDDPGDVGALARLMTACRDGARRERMGAAARELALANSLEANFERILAVYDEVVSAKRKTGNSSRRRPFFQRARGGTVTARDKSRR